jgi:hypothetical protein
MGCLLENGSSDDVTLFPSLAQGFKTIEKFREARELAVLGWPRNRVDKNRRRDRRQCNVECSLEQWISQ